MLQSSDPSFRVHSPFVDNDGGLGPDPLEFGSSDEDDFDEYPTGHLDWIWQSEDVVDLDTWIGSSPGA